jgi:hypothetical protein
MAWLDGAAVKIQRGAHRPEASCRSTAAGVSGGAGGTSPEQTRQKEAALLRVKGVQAADAGITCRMFCAKTARPTPERKMGDRPQRGQLFITVTLLPVKLRITLLLAKPGERVEGVV